MLIAKDKYHQWIFLPSGRGTGRQIGMLTVDTIVMASLPVGEREGKSGN